MKTMSVLVAVLLLPLSDRAPESESFSRGGRLDLNPNAATNSREIGGHIIDDADVGGLSINRTEFAARTFLDWQLTVPPKHVVKRDSSIRDGIAAAEQLNVSALRIYQRKVEEKLRSLFPVMPVLYPPPLERNDLPIERGAEAPPEPQRVIVPSPLLRA